MNPERFRQIRRVFEAALDLPSPARDAYLAEACQGDTELAQEVARLLAAHGEPTRLPDLTPAVEVRLEGRRLGAYEILRQIGQGGMGVVYLAVRADQAFRRKVAIKVIRPQAASAETVARFQREREILASLDHPNIAGILDGGTTDEGWPYFVMEYIEGEPIDRYCDRHRLTIEARLLLFDQVCAAVQHAHTRQVIHRDLKPNNILVTAAGEVKLLDFGIAHSQEMPRTLTQAGMRAMTPEYASPEQVRGEAVGVASDVYSLGVVLYELLTGHAPLRLHSRVFHEIARVICEELPKPPSTAVTDAPVAPGDASSPEALARLRESSLVELQSRLKGDLDHVVLKALEKQPPARYLSAGQFRQDIERYRNGQPVIARANALAPKLLWAAARHKAPIGAGLLLAVALATGAIRINTGAMQWVSAAALLLALLALATSQRWGRAVARIIVSHHVLVALACIAAVFALLVTFEPKLRIRNVLGYVNLAAIGFALAVFWWGRRSAGELLAESSRRSSWRYVAATLAVFHLAYSLFSPKTDWLNTLIWTAIAAQAYLIAGRLQVREHGLLAAGFWIPWGSIESWTWRHPRESTPDKAYAPDYWLLRIERRTGIPLFDVIQMKVLASSRPGIEATMARYLAPWPSADESAPAAALPITRKS